MLGARPTIDCRIWSSVGLISSFKSTLPFVMRFNLPTRKAEFARIAELLGERADAEQAIVAVEKLKRDIGIPERLRNLNRPPKQEQLRDFSEKAFAIKRILRVNPRTANVDECEAIYRAAW